MPVNIILENIYNILIDKLSNSTIKSKFYATIIHTGDKGDLPIPGTDKFTFKFVPTFMGQVKPANGTSFDVDIVADQNDPNKLYASIEVIGTAYGRCKLTGSKAGGSAWTSNTVLVDITSTEEVATIVTQPAPALQISDNTGKPGDPANLITKMIVLVTDKDNNPIPETNVTFKVKDVRTNPAKQTAVFYDDKSSVHQLTPFKPKNEKSDAIVTLLTDKTGNALLYIGANNNPGYLKINVSSSSSNGENAFIYIYDTGRGTEMDAPITEIGTDLSNYNKEKFPVIVTNYAVEDDEFVGVFLNDKYQAQVSGKDLNQNDSEIRIKLDTANLVIGDKNNKTYNNTFYARRTSKGDLINSKQYYYTANGPLPDPEPTNQILDFMVNPNGGAINIGSIYVGDYATDFITTINLAGAAKTLLDKMQYVLKANDIVKVHATFQGDYESDDQFQQNSFKYTKAISDPNDSAFHIKIPADDITGYGTSKEAGKRNIYSMYYDVTPENGAKPIAESKITRGVLSTRKI